MLGNQDTGDRQNYQKLVQALQDRFAPSNQTELYRAQLRERRQKASETLPEMGQKIRRLTNLAYPTASSELKATEQFLDGLFDPEMRLKIKQARPVNLNDAIQRAVELEAFNRAERRRNDNVYIIDKASSEKGSRMETFMKKMQKSIGLLQEEVESLKRGLCQERGQGEGHTGPCSADQNHGPDSAPRNRDRRCYNCQALDHFARNCPHPPRDGYKNTHNTGQQDHPKADTYKVEQCSRNIKESGLYVKALIGGMETSLLIDTGATISLLSRVLFESLLKDKSYELKGVFDPIFSANGTQIDIIGQTEVCVAIGESKLQQSVVIADIRVDGILGMDFLKNYNCVINLQRETLLVSGTDHPVKSDRFLERQQKVWVLRRTSLPSRPFVNASAGSTCISDKVVVTQTFVERQCNVPIKQALRRRRLRHKKTKNKVMYQKHECYVVSTLTETTGEGKNEDGWETSDLDVTRNLETSVDTSLARTTSSVFKNTDKALVVGYIMRKRMQLSLSVKTRQIDRETDDRTQNSSVVEFDRSVARLLKNGSKAEAQLKMTDISGSKDIGLEAVEDLVRTLKEKG